MAQVWFAYATTELMIILARMFAGLFTGGIFVSFLTYIVNKSDPEDQGKYLTYSATIKSVASAFGYMIGGFLGEFSVRLAFLVQAGTLIAVAIAFFLICEPDSTANLKDIPAKQLMKEANPFQAFIDSRNFMCMAFVFLFAFNIFINFGNTGFDQAFNYYLKAQLGLTSSYNGIIKAGVGFVSFIANMSLCIWIIKKTNVKKSMVVLTAFCALASIGTLISVKIGIFILFSILVYAGYSVSVPVLQNMVADQASPEQKNLVMGFFNATQSLGSIAGSLTAGFIYSVNAKLPFACTFVIYSVGVAAAVGVLLGVLCDAHLLLDPKILKLLVLGIVALLLSGIGGIMGGYIMYFIKKGNYNPVIGIAAVSCVPTTAKVAQKLVSKDNPDSFILGDALGANISGVITSAIITGIYITIIPYL